MRSKDISGMRSGKVVAIEPTAQRRRNTVLWKCRCDCGKEFLTEGYKVSSGVIKSCGCVRGEKQIKDLTGRKFGKLTAMHRLDKKIGTSYAWLCLCECGNQTEVSANALLCGGTKSCGCSKAEALKRKAVDITGKRFGKLVAINPTAQRINNSVVWHCRCDCGNEIDLPYQRLSSGNTKSCGCLLTENENLAKYMHYIDGTCIENLEFKGLRKNNTSGYTGVIAYRGKWKAQITFKNKRYNLGTYDNFEDAVAVRKEAEERIFGKFLDWYYETYQVGMSNNEF